MRTAFSMLLATLLVTGCIFPSFDNMQKDPPPKGDDSTTESSPTEETVKRIEIGGMDAAPEASIVASSPDAGVDAAADVVVAPPPGAGKVACGTTECAVGPSIYCCAGYAVPAFECRPVSELIPSGCAGGDAHALFCDEKADCPSNQFCCDEVEGIGTVAQCSATCGGKILCKVDSDCPDGRKCTGTLDSDVPNKVCGP